MIKSEREREKRLERLERTDCKIYQKTIIESENKYVIGNIPRQAGKTFTLVNKVIVDRPKNCIHIGNCGLESGNFIDDLCELIKRLKNCSYNINQKASIAKIIEVEWEDSTITTIYCENQKETFEKDRGFIDLVLMDDLLPMGDFPFEFGQCLSMVTLNANLTNLYRGRRDIDIHTYGLKDVNREGISIGEDSLRDFLLVPQYFMRELDICNDYFYDYYELKQEGESLSEWIDKEVVRLRTEFDTLKGSRENTLHRKDLIQMIEQLAMLKQSLYK